MPVRNGDKTHCNSDHAFTVENTRHHTGSNGKPRRSCRECERLSAAAYYHGKLRPRLEAARQSQAAMR